MLTYRLNRSNRPYHLDTFQQSPYLTRSILPQLENPCVLAFRKTQSEVTMLYQILLQVYQDTRDLCQRYDNQHPIWFPIH